MGSLGGRHEEADWLELGAVFNINNLIKWNDEIPKVTLYTLFSMFPSQGQYMDPGTEVGIQELYFTVDDQIKNIPIQFWAGFIYYRSNNIESADYPFQNQKDLYSTNFDPFIKRIIVTIQHKIRANQKHHFDLLSEFHTTGWEYLDDT